MARGRAALVAATLPWLLPLLFLLIPVAADGSPPPITISPTEPPASDAVQVRFYQYFTSGVDITLLRNEVVGNVVEVEHHFSITNLPTITEFDETHTYEGLSGPTTLRWTRHYEYAGEVQDSVLEVPFEVPLTDPVVLGVPALDSWARAATVTALGLLLAWGVGRRRDGGWAGKNVT